MTNRFADLSFPKIQSDGIRAVMRNQRIMGTTGSGSMLNNLVASNFPVAYVARSTSWRSQT
jgi:hypothetical protein